MKTFFSQTKKMVYHYILENEEIRKLLPLELWHIVCSFIFSSNQQKLLEKLEFPRLLVGFPEDDFFSERFFYSTKHYRWSMQNPNPFFFIQLFFHDNLVMTVYTNPSYEDTIYYDNEQ